MTEEFGTPVPPWDKEDEPPAPPHIPTTPFPAIILGMILLFAVGFFMPYVTRSHTNVTAVVGWSIAAAILAWCAGFLLAFRRTSTGWIAGSFALMLIAAVLGAEVGVTKARRAMQADRLAYASIERRPDGSFGLPDSVEPGPLTRKYLTEFNEIADIGRSRDKKVEALGIELLAHPEALTRDPSLLRDCDRFPRAKPIVDDSAGRLIALLARLQAPAPEGLSDQGKLAFETRRAADQARAVIAIRAKAAADRDRLDSAGEMCRVLATAHWQVVGGAFRFTDRADMLRFEGYRSQLAELDAADERDAAYGAKDLHDAQERAREASRW